MAPTDALRLSNTLRVQRAYRTGQWESGAGPLIAYIEVAARCNLRCPMCPITVDWRYAPGSGLPALLSAALFDRLSGVFPTLRRAHLFGLGEPLCEVSRVQLFAGVHLLANARSTWFVSPRVPVTR